MKKQTYALSDSILLDEEFDYGFDYLNNDNEGAITMRKPHGIPQDEQEYLYED